MATAQVDSRLLTYDEIVAAGIDPNDPANQHVYEFEVHLAFSTGSPVVSGYVAGGGGGGGGFYGFSGGSGCYERCTFSIGDRDVTATVGGTATHPQIVWMVLPGRAKWLKEFFSVSMMVTNLAGPQFSLSEGAATLNILHGPHPGLDRHPPESDTNG